MSPSASNASCWSWSLQALVWRPQAVALVRRINAAAGVGLGSGRDGLYSTERGLDISRCRQTTAARSQFFGSKTKRQRRVPGLPRGCAAHMVTLPSWERVCRSQQRSRWSVPPRGLA